MWESWVIWRETTGNSAMQHGQPPFSLKAFTFGALQSAILQLLSNICGQVIAHRHSIFGLFTFLSLFSWCCSFGTNAVQHWLWGVHVGCDFSTAICENSYMHFFSIPTRALAWSALNCSISCYFSSHAFFFLSASLLQRWKVLRHALKYFPLLNQSLCTCMQTH